MSPELAAILAANRSHEAAEARRRWRLHRLFLACTTVIVDTFPYLPELLTGQARWLGRDAIQVGRNVIGVDGVVRA